MNIIDKVCGKMGLMDPEDEKEELNEYLTAQEEAVKRDHNKLGRDLGFFTTVEIM